MDIVHCAQMPWGESLVAQRGATEGMAHKRLFEGEEGSPDNYMLVMSREPKSYFSPRHRHPWDQIRFCLEGKIPIAKGLFIEGGEIGYFPEAAHYGPQEGGEDRIVLLLQFGGASGQGFIGPDALSAARREMEGSGTFERGVYVTEVGGQRVNRDGYEAVWQHVMGAAPDYVSPAYKTPVVMRPEGVSWSATGDDGAARKCIGVFPHRGLSITAHRLVGGAQLALESEQGLRFVFVTEGTGSIGTHELRRWSVVRRMPGDAATSIASHDTLELVEFCVAPVETSGGA